MWTPPTAEQLLILHRQIGEMIAAGVALLAEPFDDSRWDEWIARGRGQIERALGDDWADRFEHAGGPGLAIISLDDGPPTEQERIESRNEDVNGKLGIARAAHGAVAQEIELLGATPAPAALPTRSFAKMQDLPLRGIAERDYEELRKVTGQTVMASTILAGGVIEAVLYDALKQRGYSPSKLDDMRLQKLVSEAVTAGVIGARAQSAADNAREARNLIHPALELKDGRLTKGDADVVVALMSRVLEEVL